MPIYMDLHIVPGVKAKEVAQAHQMDLNRQNEFGCTCMTYWIDEDRGYVFCLIDAPDKDAVSEMHRNTHGLVPHKIIEVSSRTVNSFLGRIYDPENSELTKEGLQILKDTSFRFLLVTKNTDPYILLHKLGADKSKEVINYHNGIIRKNLEFYGGTEVEHEGDGFIISFLSASKVVDCALAIQKEMNNLQVNGFSFKIAVNAGDPVEKSNQLFGTTIQLADNICFVSDNFQIVISSKVRELVANDLLNKRANNFLSLSLQDEEMMQLLFSTLEKNWYNPDFNISDYCKETAMSISKLYRKTILHTGLSFNSLLKEYRLEKAKELMRKNFYSISQITFESGFSSASYFSKCFKKKYGLLPMSYLELLR